MPQRVLILTFHGIGTPGPEVNRTEDTYWLRREQFTTILDSVAGKDNAVLTFDDGNESDYDTAMHELTDRGLRAMFFIVAGRLGTVAYVSRRQIREMHDAGMTIGSHGLAHRAWRRLKATALHDEIDKAKDQLEQVIGAPITHAACPFGAYDRRSLDALCRAGFKKVYTSDGGEASSDDWLQTRNTIRQPDPIRQVQSLFETRESMTHRSIRLIKSAIKRQR